MSSTGPGETSSALPEGELGEVAEIGAVDGCSVRL
jgi:hypothetical protein